MIEGIRHRFRNLTVAAGIALLGFVIGGLLTVLVAQGFIAAGVPVRKMPALKLGISVVTLQGIGFGSVALASRKLEALDPDLITVRKPTLREGGWIIVGFVVLIGLLSILSRLFSVLGIGTAQNKIQQIGTQNPIVFLVLIPLSFLLIGPGEELLFRGFVQGTLRNSYSTIGAIVLASSIFAVGHATSLQGSGKIAYMAIVFVLSLILGLAYERTDNLLVPAMIHGAYNALLFGMMYYTMVGIQLTITNQITFTL